jgi:RNA-binding protein
MSLTGKQRRFLRGLGHPLTAVVTIGRDGITPGLIGAVDQALTDHELIKVRVGQNADLDRAEAGARLAAETASEVAQTLGRTILLYRRHPDEPTIELPASGEPV